MKSILRIFRRFFWIICYFLPIKKNKIVFQSYYGRGYSDNPKYIAEELLKQGQRLDYVWVVSSDENNELPKEFRTVKFRSFKYIYEMSTAKIWVDNSRKEYCLKKKGQYYMQTWHGSLGFKKVENMVPEKLSKKYLKMAKLDAKQCDVMLSSCDILTNDYRKYFWYAEGEIIQKGIPRNDRLINFTKDEADQIRQKLSIDKDIKLLLYAPTFRQSGDLSVYNIDYSRCIKALEKRFGGTWKVILRLHPNIFKLSDDLEFDPETVINVSYYPDMQELYMIADMVITDYSSVIFDFLLIEKPSMLYASDIEEYKKERDFCFSFEELPFTLCENNDELEKEILNFDTNEYLKKIKDYKKQVGFSDNGQASKYAAKWITNIVKE